MVYALIELEGDKLPPSIVGIVLTEFFEKFHMQESFEHNLNVTFLVFIPKKGDVDEIKDFRLINLAARFYKLIEKVLANRLKKKKSDEKGGFRVDKF